MGSICSWTDQAFLPQLFTQLLSDDLDHHQNVKMIFASLFRIFPNNHVTSRNRSKACVCVCLLMHVCVCVVLFAEIMRVISVCRFPVFHCFGEKYEVISISQSLFISDPKTE